MNARYLCLGSDDSESTCSCCGRRNLKRVVWLVDLEEDQYASPYGTTCAAKLLAGRKTMSRAESEAVVDEAREHALRICWTKALERNAPPVTFGVNRYNVKVAICGDSEIAYGEERGDRLHFAFCAVRDWYAHCAVEVATAQNVRYAYVYTFTKIRETDALLRERVVIAQ